MNDAKNPLLHPLLISRWSPTSFDGSVQLGDEEVESLVEFAPWLRRPADTAHSE